jgi:hypothetical protein
MAVSIDTYHTEIAIFVPANECNMLSVPVGLRPYITKLTYWDLAKITGISKGEIANKLELFVVPDS